MQVACYLNLSETMCGRIYSKYILLTYLYGHTAYSCTDAQYNASFAQFKFLPKICRMVLVAVDKSIDIHDCMRRRGDSVVCLV